ncbi:MAG: phosphate/phosphite/phosphonate ABC transporter substrate-binding protein [Anaerolineales bacterium]|nr:phosphate/phosphite/phosphonate ABC transporter substrate-binding protein [Anaerolineales bacterium]
MKKSLSLSFAVIVVLALALAACAPATPAPTEAPTAVPATAVPTDVPEPTATAVPELGTADNPLVMALAPSATTQELQTGGQAIADKLSELTGYTITVTVPTNYAAMIEAMGAGNAHIGWLAPVQYIVAHGNGYADVGLATVRNGSNHYGVQFVVNSDWKDKDGNGFTLYYDAATGKDTADAATALAQLADKKPCWTDPLSASGYIIPSGILKKEEVKAKAGAWVQGHPTVIKSVYLSPKGEICDFGATFIDARSNVVADFPDVNDKVQILWVTDPFIPNDNVSYASNVPADMRDKLSQALLDLASTEDGITLLKNGGYSIQGLEKVDDTFYDDFRVYLEASGVDPTTLFK